MGMSFWLTQLQAQELNPEQMHADLRIFREGLERFHPEIYRYTDKTTFANHFSSIESSIKSRDSYMKTRFKNGPGHADFGNWIEWHVNPSSSTFLKPVAVLTDRGTGSAGETFILAMRKNENVTFVGNFTNGAFSDNHKKELPNGWIVAMSTGDFRDDAGISYEGIGLEPDQLVINTPEQVANGLDRAILAAFGVLLGN